MTGVDLVLATRNRKKAGEIRRLLRDLDIRIRTLDDFPGCPAVPEDGRTYEENAVKKAVVVAGHTGQTALADDSGLEVDALDGAPGVRSARYAGERADDRMNLDKLLEDLRAVDGARRQARFVCCIALALPDGRVQTFSGTAQGTLGTEPRGSRGFGYDPIFYPRGARLTFAEMDDDDKHAISHRGIALQALKRYLAAKRDRAPLE